ncbi:MAG: efflux RND transporter periplasmic adaptor subunit [Deferribacterota bacterium]|nr:efflux RND transporter periplasmic adaptor subunit [Deferribacterota bacterium]
MKSCKNIFLMFFVVIIISCSNIEKKEKTSPYDKPDTFIVDTIKVHKEVSGAKITFSGTVISDETVMLMPKIIGYIQSINVDIGDSFYKDDVLVSIRSDELDAKLKMTESAVTEACIGLRQTESGLKMAHMEKRKAKAQFILAEKTYKRYKRLLKSESVSQYEYDQVLAEYLSAKEHYNIAIENVNMAEKKLNQAEAKLKQSKAMFSESQSYVNYKKIKAPFDGIVLQKFSDEGNLASPGSAVLKIGTHKKVIKADIGEDLFDNVFLGDNVTINYPSRNITFTSKIKKKSSQISPNTRKFIIETNANNDLPVGAYVKITLNKGQIKGIFIPKTAVKQVGQLDVAIIKEGDQAKMRVLKLGRETNNIVEVLSGLDGGERLVLTDVELIKSGDILVEK